MFTMKFDTDNAAFEMLPRTEIRFILERVREQVQNGQNDGKIMDVNGNSIGKWEYTV